jgi:hypothetical protein
MSAFDFLGALNHPSDANIDLHNFEKDSEFGDCLYLLVGDLTLRTLSTRTLS